ncbi:hypothetical protein F2Q69_00013186 [Brassica cretica]|uniref:Uncharacterized protein n=1 Tax=Brassica cretica TaxID=69181 RepID=A0A8S9QRD2_BRACR|nr:hypothetical protein F2Q69_00013186 [Brassica cretica]
MVTTYKLDYDDATLPVIKLRGWALKEYKHYILAGGLTGRIRVFDCEELTEHMLSWKPFRINQFDRGVLKPVYALSNAARAHIHFFQRQIFSVQLWCRKMCESDVATRGL